MKIRRFFTRVYMNDEPGVDGSGDAVVADLVSIASDDSAGALDQGGTADSPGAAEAPKDLQSAMFPQAVDKPTAEGHTRDEKGRFAAKTADGQPAPTQPDPNKKPEHQMPEGLSEQGQKRFQTLVNTNKELTTRVEQWQPVVNSALELQSTFQENGIRREQFDQAMQVVGMMNRGDLEGALRALDQQREMISMSLGRPIPGANVLGRFPDLQAQVENLQLSESAAIELARARTRDHGAQQQYERRQAQEQAQAQQAQVEQREVRSGQVAVDQFCRQRMSEDLDYAKIEPILLKEIQEGLLEGVPPSRWSAIVEKSYRLIKQSSAAARPASQPANVLRSTGVASPRAAPKDMFQAMFGGGGSTT